MFSNNATDRKIYVPYGSVDKYRAASYWSDYKDDIVAYDFEKDEIYDPNAGENTKIYYTATSKIEPYYTGVGFFGAEIVSNEWDATAGEGVITFDGEVTLIGDCAFYRSTNLISVTIPEGVTSIIGTAFQMSGLQEFKGKYASEDGCCVVIDGVLVAFAPKSTTSYTIPSSVAEIGDEAFCFCWDIQSVVIPQSVKRIGNYAFYDCGALSDVSIEEGVESIGDAAFMNCGSMKSATIPNSVTTIGVSLFAACENLASIEIGTGLTRLEDSMFMWCSNLVGVTIPENITSIGTEAFMNCKSLKSITLPSSIESVDGYAFYYCENLESVYCKAVTPPVANSKYYLWGAFDGNAENRVIYVPAESVDAYKSAEGWSEYADAIVGYDFGSGEILKPTQNVSSAYELQAALDSAVVGDNIITLVGDIVGEVTISQEDGKNIIIDGAGYMFDGIIHVNGNSRYNGAETLLIHDVNFKTSGSSIDFIEQDRSDSLTRYPHNITVEDCTFEGGSDVVAIRFRQAMNVTVRNCAVVGLHSLAQMNGCENILIDGVWVSDATNGVSLGNTSDCVIMNSVIIASGYGVRANPSAMLNVSNSEIHGAQPLVVRKMTDGTSYAINLDKVKLYTNDLYDIIFTSSNDEGEYVEPLGEWRVTGAEGYKIFPEAEVVAVANVSNEEELIAALEAKAERIYFLNDITLSTPYLNIEDIKTEIFGQGYKLTVSAMSKNYSLIVSGQSDVVINDLVINDRGGFYVYGVSNLVVNNVNVRANYSSTGRFIFYVEVESTVTVNGGKYSTNRSRIHYFYTGAGSKITVTDGEFGDNISGGGDLVSTANAGIVEFKGGTFTSTSRDFDPTQWVAEGYEAIKDGDTWTVQAK